MVASAGCSQPLSRFRLGHNSNQSIEVTSETKNVVKLVAAAGLVVVAVGFAASRIGLFRKSGDAGAMAWFYDESEKRLYKTPRDTVPPDKGIGGPGGDGVRAVVVASDPSESNPAKLRIAYLETHTSSLKKILDGVRAAHLATRRFEGKIPPRDSTFYQENTLVRRENDTDWHTVNSTEGHKIVTEWRSWRGPDGQRPSICGP